MEPNEKRAFEPTGLVPRSIVRTFERFRQQLLPGSERAVIREYRISRYQVLVSVRCLFALLTIPIATNWFVSSWLLSPLIEHFWNTQQNEIFLNSYQEERAFTELEFFSDKLFFESLLNKNSNDGVKNSKTPMLGYAKNAEERSYMTPQLLSLEVMTPMATSFLSPSLCADEVAKYPWKPDLKSSFSPTVTKNIATVTNSQKEILLRTGSKARKEGDKLKVLGPLSVLDTRFLYESGSQPKSPDLISVANEFFTLPCNEGSFLIKKSDAPNKRITLQDDLSMDLPSAICNKSVKLLRHRNNIVNLLTLLSPEVTNVNKESFFTYPYPEFVQYKLQPSLGNFYYPFVNLKGFLDFSVPLTLPENACEIIFSWKVLGRNRVSLNVTSNASLNQVESPYSPRGYWVLGSLLYHIPSRFAESSQQLNKITDIDINATEGSLKIKEKIQEKLLELAVYYNQQTILSITNVAGDLISVFTLGCLFIWMKPEISILKSFLVEAIYSLSDTTKSFLLILLTDLLVGFHSPRGWETALELLLKHFGLPENQDFVFLFVATFPVLLDTVFKYWIFRHLNKISPSTVATYHSMIE